MISLFICIHFIHEFAENIQETNDVSSQSKSLNVADKYVVLETPQKDKKNCLKTLILCSKARVDLKTQVYFYHQQQENFTRV